jgi:RNA polymerase sigma factor (sigma-70 family)
VSEEDEAVSSRPRDFEDFSRGSYHRLVRRAMYLGVTPEQAEDIVQNVMVAMLRRWTEIRDEASYAPRAVLNNVKDERKDQFRLSRRLAEAGYVPQSEGAEDARLDVWEDEEWVTQVLSCLKPSQRAVMEGVLAELTSAEIGALLGTTDSNVRQTLHTARNKLRDHLAKTRERGQEGSREEVR